MELSILVIFVETTDKHSNMMRYAAELKCFTNLKTIILGWPPCGTSIYIGFVLRSLFFVKYSSNMDASWWVCCSVSSLIEWIEGFDATTVQNM